MFKERLERRLSKGTRSQEGTKASVSRYRFNEIMHSAHDSGALKLRPNIEVEIERLSFECRDKIKTILQTEKAKSTEVNPFADIPLGIRRIYLNKGPLHIEVTGDKFDKVPWILTAVILETVCGLSYQGARDIVYLPTEKGPKRMKDVGLFYQGEEPVAAMYLVHSEGNDKIILVRSLESREQILVKYKPAGSSDGKSRLGYRYFIDYQMFSPSWIKQDAIEILTHLENEFTIRYEPTLAQTKKEFLRERRREGSIP